MKPPAWRGALLVPLIVAGCATPQEPLPSAVLPLATLASSARSWLETDEIDIGSASARPALWGGWGPDEANPEMSFAWGIGEASTLNLAIVEPRTRTLRLRGWAFPFGDDPPLEVELRLNGRPVAKRLISTRPGSLQVEIERDFWRAGENVLELVYSRHDRHPGDLPRAAGWDGLRFDDRRDGGVTSAAVGDGGVVVLPARTALEWALELPADSWLAWDAVTTTGDAQLVLTVRDEAAERQLRLAGSGSPVRLTPGAGPHRLVGFTLAAAGGQGEVRIAGVRLHLPPHPTDAPLEAPINAPLEAPIALRAESASPPAAPAPPASARPNVLIYLVDTLRADRLGCYGYGRPTSPAIDRFARSAALWRDGRAQSSWTRPAVATVLTGLQPPTHRAQESYDRLPEDVVTVAERFAAAGWQSAMITTNGNVAARAGFNQGWDAFYYLAERRRTREHHVQSAEVNGRVFEWLDHRDPARPFLLFVHTSDPHDPYTPPVRFRELLAPQVRDPRIGLRPHIASLYDLPADAALAERAALSALYDAEVAANDDSFGRLLAGLERRDLGANTAVLLISDHGEEFFEHGGWTHGRTLYEEQLRIPFVLRLPGGEGAGQVLPGPAEQVDVAPTLLALAGLPGADELPGRNLLADLRGAGPRRGETQSLAWLSRNDLTVASIVRTQWKLIHNERSAGDWRRPPFELYGLASDADELADRARSQPLRRAWLEGLLSAAWQRFGTHLASERAELDAELEANLRALGYL